MLHNIDECCIPCSYSTDFIVMVRLQLSRGLIPQGLLIGEFLAPTRRLVTKGSPWSDKMVRTISCLLVEVP